ncbi:MAG: hypothetical protein HYT78_20385 [Deltaproteobacteria bacterium]|nr:hypothetical protein [Deltaproteobacteria bacterium]
MERINPVSDHLELVYNVLHRTTLASGEPALVLQREGEQFVIGAAKFLAAIKANR